MLRTCAGAFKTNNAKPRKPASYMWDGSRGLSQDPTNVRDTHAHPMFLASGQGRNPRPGSTQTLALLTCFVGRRHKTTSCESLSWQARVRPWGEALVGGDWRVRCWPRKHNPSNITCIASECGVAVCLCGAIAWPGARSVRNAHQQTFSQPATCRYSNSGVRPAMHSCSAAANCLLSAWGMGVRCTLWDLANLPEPCPITLPTSPDARMGMGNPPPCTPLPLLLLLCENPLTSAGRDASHAFTRGGRQLHEEAR